MGYVLLMIAVSYLAGSFPTSLLAGKWLKGIDIREHGSGNAGATNVLRVLGPAAGSIVLLIDILKGLIPTLFADKLALPGLAWEPVTLQIMSGFAAMCGHIWSIFAQFKGGKGVATAAGMIIGLLPQPVLLALLVFVVTVGLTRYVSLGSILASLALPVAVFGQQMLYAVNYPLPLQLLSVFIPLLIIYTHRSNIQRLLRGEEGKIFTPK